MSAEESKDTETVVEDLSNSDVVTKYRTAAEIANSATRGDVGRPGAVVTRGLPSSLPAALAETLQGVVTQCVAGKDIAEICKFGDTLIERQAGMIFKSKKARPLDGRGASGRARRMMPVRGRRDAQIDKGIAFPTCISVNECLSHFSPLKSESTALNAGDLIKMCAPARPRAPCRAREPPLTRHSFNARPHAAIWAATSTATSRWSGTPWW